MNNGLNNADVNFYCITSRNGVGESLDDVGEKAIKHIDDVTEGAVKHIDEVSKVADVGVSEAAEGAFKRTDDLLDSSASEIVTKGTGCKNVDVDLKYKDGWTSSQRAEADAKLKVLSEADTVKTQVNRQGTSASSRYKAANGQGSVPPKYDVDHVVDLQLGGAEDIVNMSPLDQSVNRSLGKQIQNAIYPYPDGTTFGNFNIK